MIKDLAWKTFKNTGNIDTFFFFFQLEQLKNIQSNIYNQKVELDGNNKDQGYNNI